VNRLDAGAEDAAQSERQYPQQNAAERRTGIPVFGAVDAAPKTEEKFIARITFEAEK
jgi:hypothetical protein